MNTQRKGLIAVLATAALVLSGCAANGGGNTPGASSGEGGATTGGTITAGVAYETTNYHPSNTSSALAMGTNWHVVEGLYEFDMTDYSVYPALAADPEPTKISDTEYEVALRADAKFSDGTPVTADDVVKSFERSTAEGNLYASMLTFIDSVTKKDDTTVTITLTEPFSFLKQRLAVVKIVPKDASDDDLTAKPIGSGPYKYDEITDTQVTAVKNEFYNGPRPATADKIQWSVLKDDTARGTALQDGSIAVMENVPAKDVQLLESAGMTVEKKDGFNLPFLLFDTVKKPFDDPRVRQAFFYAIDRQKLIDNNLAGEAKVATSFLPEDHPNYNKAATQYDYNPEKAKELLSEAGVSNLSITLLTTDHPWVQELAPQIMQDLQAVGIQVNVQTETSASLYANNLDIENPTFDVALAPGDPSVFGNDPALLINWWYGDNIWTTARSNWQKSDPETFQQLQDLVKKGTTLEGAEAQDVWNQALDLIAANVPIYPLFHRTMITAYNPQLIDNVTPISTTGLQLLKATPKQ